MRTWRAALPPLSEMQGSAPTIRSQRVSSRCPYCTALIKGVSPFTVVRVFSNGDRDGMRPHKAITQSISPALAATIIFFESVKREEGGEGLAIEGLAGQSGRQRACAKINE